MHEVLLTFYLEEEVTPEIFARKIATACSYRGAIRENEMVAFGNVGWRYEGDTEIDLLGGDPFTVPDIRKVKL